MSSLRKIHYSNQIIYYENSDSKIEYSEDFICSKCLVIISLSKQDLIEEHKAECVSVPFAAAVRSKDLCFCRITENTQKESLVLLCNNPIEEIDAWNFYIVFQTDIIGYTKRRVGAKDMCYENIYLIPIFQKTVFEKNFYDLISLLNKNNKKQTVNKLLQDTLKQLKINLF